MDTKASYKRIYIIAILMVTAVYITAMVTTRSKEPPCKTGREKPSSFIRPYKENPHYLSWDGIPVFPLGATNFHSWTPISRPENVDIQAHMNRLKKALDEVGSRHVCGFVRCLPYDPMNHMHDGEVSRVLQPWKQLKDGRYDLSQFAPEWESRLREYLQAALDRRILVSLEVWDDWSVTRGPNGQYDPGPGAAWNAHPFNPGNNINYDETVLPSSTAACDAPFYSTIPSRENNEKVLQLQKQYVDQLLTIASDYPNILINVTNESRAHLAWSRFWVAYIQERIPRGMMVGDMPSTNRKDGGGECQQDLNPLNLALDSHYDYVDVSQGVSGHEFNTITGQVIGGAQRLFEYRQSMVLKGTEKPLVVSKDYTRDEQGGTMVLWSRFVGGAAAARFHRPHKDHGDEVVDFQHQTVLNLGKFVAGLPFWRMYPAPELIKELPEGAQANVLAEPEGHTVLQMIGGKAGEQVTIDLAAGNWHVQWLDPLGNRELAKYTKQSRAHSLILELPGDLQHRILHVFPSD